MVIDHLDLFTGPLNIFFVEKLLVCGDVGDSYEVMGDVLVDEFCWMGHVDISFEAGTLSEIGKTCTMVHMEMGQQKEINLFGINHVKVRESLDSFSCWVQTAIQHDLTTLALHVETGTADFTSCAERHDFKVL